MMAIADDVAANMEAAGGSYFVTAVVGSLDDWFRPRDDRRRRGPSCSPTSTGSRRSAAAHGLTQVVHPHVDTLIETGRRVRPLPRRPCDAKFCFDTGHLTIGGADVVALARERLDRIGIVHLKDVDGDVAARERAANST